MTRQKKLGFCGVVGCMGFLFFKFYDPFLLAFFGFFGCLGFLSDIYNPDQLDETKYKETITHAHCPFCTRIL